MGKKRKQKVKFKFKYDISEKEIVFDFIAYSKFVII